MDCVKGPSLLELQETLWIVWALIVHFVAVILSVIFLVSQGLIIEFFVHFSFIFRYMKYTEDELF